MPTLIVLLGPTGVGKTAVSISLAKWLGEGVEIFSSDSRQIYRETVIGTAAPTREELEAVPHHFIGFKSVTEYFSASAFEALAMERLSEYFKQKPVAILCGGSMMYTDALCFGIDEIPDVDPKIRQELYERYEKEGIQFALKQLQTVDPEYLTKVDLNNYKRLLHALEVYLSTGLPFSSFHKQTVKQRPFRIIRIGLNRDRAELYDRINKRVDQMVESGLVEEVRSLLPYRSLNALNTVGYKEIFDYLDGACTLEEAVARIKKNTRVYARKQLTWYRKAEDIVWFSPDNPEEIKSYLSSQLEIEV
ncbi:MAG: tRNA (adenosine(37)-N6)-dimethylallyltransferase MiaA [Porphyromonas sp.]|nr:tRNA (adenosine(37)-N6)-dimethylallyltransferase MiaA [Porphyromonas sp.]